MPRNLWLGISREVIGTPPRLRQSSWSEPLREEQKTHRTSMRAKFPEKAETVSGTTKHGKAFLYFMDSVAAGYLRIYQLHRTYQPVCIPARDMCIVGAKQANVGCVLCLSGSESHIIRAKKE
jgi:hypothetical protein